MTDDPHRIVRKADKHRIIRQPQTVVSTAVSEQPQTALAKTQQAMAVPFALPDTTDVLARVKKRIETDVDDSELQAVINEASQAIIDKYGPHTDSTVPITIRMEGYRKRLVLARPIDVSETVEVIEYISEYGFGETAYTLAAEDYRIWPGGFSVERLTSGNNSRWNWAEQVELTYTPVDDNKQREEVIIKLVLLSLGYEGVSASSVGDVSETNLNYQEERDRLINSLAPWGGLYMQ